MKVFLASYRFEGKEYSLEIPAKTISEAQARIKALAWAKLDGELMGKYPAHLGWWVKLTCFVHNLFVRA